MPGSPQACAWRTKHCILEPKSRSQRTGDQFDEKSLFQVPTMVEPRPWRSRRFRAGRGPAARSAEPAPQSSRIRSSTRARLLRGVHTVHRRVPVQVRRAGVKRDSREPIDRHGTPCVQAQASLDIRLYLDLTTSGIPHRSTQQFQRFASL